VARQLFGTDGIRGKAGEAPLDPATAYALGAALADWAKDHLSTVHTKDPHVLLGMDTRESGPWLAETVAAGLASRQVTPHFAGLLSTPGVAWNTKNGPYVAGVMISASHNPYEDNGLKVFDHSGYKLPDADELALEEQILQIRQTALPSRHPLSVEEELPGAYIDALAATFPHSLAGMKLVVDCAHGAATPLAPALFTRLGATVIPVACAPNGRNINDGVGALHTNHVREEVLAHQADLGVAFDGDADRAMFVSSAGRLIDGDAVLLVTARRLQTLGQLAGSRVVATVMSNIGLQVALARTGITMARTAVGDKYVLEEMLRSGNTLGGEQSGHVIFSALSTTGDGMLTALRLLDAIVASGQSLDALTADFEVFPQILVNVRVKEKRPLQDLTQVQSDIADVESSLGSQGRVLVRFSGTESLARVMVEGPTQAEVESHAHRIANSLRAELGA
jgi:phosphoglucosamine mutase